MNCDPVSLVNEGRSCDCERDGGVISHKGKRGKEREREGEREGRREREREGERE